MDGKQGAGDLAVEGVDATAAGIGNVNEKATTKRGRARTKRPTHQEKWRPRNSTE